MLIHAIALSASLFLLTVNRVPLWGALLLIAGANALLTVDRWGGKRAQRGMDALDYYAQKSRLKSMAASLKSAVCLGSLVLCVTSTSPIYCYVVFFLMMGYAVGMGKTSAAYFLSLFRAPILFIALSSLAILCDITLAPGEYWSVSLAGVHLSVTAIGQQTAFLAMSRAIGAVACLYAYSLSTPMAQTIRFLRRAKCPDILIELMYLTYRYIFVLSNLRSAMEAAANARFGNWNLRAGYRSLTYCVQNLLFLSFRRARSGFDAMESRCYDGTLRFLSDEQTVSRAEWAMAASYLLAMGVVFALCRVLT